MFRIPELLAPAGGMEQLRAAVENGAHAVYMDRPVSLVPSMKRATRFLRNFPTGQRRRLQGHLLKKSQGRKE